MVTVDDFSRLVSVVYGAAISPERWEIALSDLVRTFDATASGLIVADPSTREIRVNNIGVDPSATRSYNEYYRHLDYVASSVEKGPVGAVYSGSELISPRSQSEFDVDWLRPNGFGDGVFARLGGSSACTWIAIAAPQRREPFGTRERVELMRQLVPHLQLSIRTQRKLCALDRCRSDLAGAIEHVHHGIVIVGPDCRILLLNSAATAILSAGDGLVVRARSQVSAMAIHVDRALSLVVERALGEHGSSAVPSGGSFACPRPSGRRPYVINVIPLCRKTSGLGSSTPTCLIVLVDPELQPEPDASVLGRLFGLTKTESEVALHVLQGAGLRSIGEDLSVSLATIRTHLQHVFHKTDTHRQAELIRLLLTVYSGSRESRPRQL